MSATVYHHRTGEIMTIGRSTCSCGFSIYRLALNGIQRFDTSRALELRTCPDCRETLSVALPAEPHVRRARCEELIVEMAKRDDVPGFERARLIQHMLDEMTEALREINAAKKR